MCRDGEGERESESRREIREESRTAVALAYHEKTTGLLCCRCLADATAAGSGGGRK